MESARFICLYFDDKTYMQNNGCDGKQLLCKSFGLVY